MKTQMEDPHAVAKMQYAVDALRYMEPWRQWYFRSSNQKQWQPLICVPKWKSNLSYRRLSIESFESQGIIFKPHHHAEAMMEYANDFSRLKPDAYKRWVMTYLRVIEYVNRNTNTIKIEKPW